eukprot:ANDGO_03924.mRNA.1 putative beta-tubulin polyglutamylase
MEDDRPVRRGTGKKVSPVIFCMVNCKYQVVRDACLALGLVETDKEDEFHLFWIDTSVSVERVKKLKLYQRINHFPGMLEICRKAAMGRNLNRLKHLLPETYNFYPKTFVLPSDYAALRSYVDLGKEKTGKNNRTLIVKPSAGCQGKGIFMTRRLEDIPPFMDAVVQKYLGKPFLIDGFKFDMRVYVLVASCDPLPEIYLYADGLVRICTEKYVEPNGKNMDCAFMHLTNYAINKNNDNFVQNDGAEEDAEGSATKRSIVWFRSWLRKNGYDDQRMWDQVGDIVIKSILSIASHLKSVSQTCGANEKCFEILGFDIMVDKKLFPWLIEINHSPSFTTDSELDQRIKEDLISGAVSMMNIRPLYKKKYDKFEKEECRRRLLSSGGSSSLVNSSNLPSALMQYSKASTAPKRERLAEKTLYEKIFPTESALEKYGEVLEVERLLSKDSMSAPPVVIAKLESLERPGSAARASSVTRYKVSVSMFSSISGDFPSAAVSPSCSNGPSFSNSSLSYAAAGSSTNRVVSARSSSTSRCAASADRKPNLVPINPSRKFY